MIDTFRNIDVLRGEMPVEEAIPLLLLEATKHDGYEVRLSGDLERRWQAVRDRPVYPHLQAGARAFLVGKGADRLKTSVDILRTGLGKARGPEFLGLVPARLVAEALGTPASLRASFGSSAIPVLCAALAAKEAGRSMRTRFVDRNADICDLVAIIAALVGVEVDVVLGDPLGRKDGGEFEAELTMPPFGAQILDRETLPQRTLDRLGASEKARLQYEPAVIADALAHAKGARVVMNVVDSVLFRAVGIEAIMREEMVESGRLRAVLRVPPGMIFDGTPIVTNFIMLGPEDEPSGAVRFLDLEDDRYSHPMARGRREALPDASWSAAVEEPVGEGSTWARDVPVTEIREQGHVLTVPRYLQTQAAVVLDAFLERHGTKALGEIVEIIRPKALPKDEDGEHKVREASPGDIGEAGYLGEPPRAVRLARAGLRVARNQRVSPGDVLLSIKGTIGRVGLVPLDAPQIEDAFWTVSQSLVILRSRGRVAPEALYEFLSSDAMQDHLASLAGGTAIKSITAKELAALAIPIPDVAEQDRIVQAFRERLEIYEQIDQLYGDISTMRSAAWPHHDLEGESA